MRTLFKNCRLLDFDHDTFDNVDILVSDEKIERITPNIKSNVENVVDIKNNLVMPAFSNCFYRSSRAICNSYLEKNKDFSNDERKILREFISRKNILAGVTFGYDFEDEIPFQFLEKVGEKSEKELEDIGFNLKNEIFIKIGQNLKEMGEINSQSKMMPSEYLESFGFFDKKSVIIGGNCFEKDELEIFSNYNTSFVLLPNDDARFGRRFPNLNTLQKYGFPLGLGSGDYAEIDFFAFMRQILSYNSFVMENSGLIHEKEVLKMATIEGAKILGLDGSVKENNYANFIVLNFDNSLYQDIYKAIVFGMNKKDVKLTVKNGKILQQNGVFVMENGDDYDKIILQTNEILRR